LQSKLCGMVRGVVVKYTANTAVLLLVCWLVLPIEPNIGDLLQPRLQTRECLIGANCVFQVFSHFSF
jgi:hypothetical protein